MGWVVGYVGQAEGRIPVGGQRAEGVVVHPPRPAQHAHIELEQRWRVSAGEGDGEERDHADHHEGHPQESQHDECGTARTRFTSHSQRLICGSRLASTRTGYVEMAKAITSQTIFAYCRVACAGPGRAERPFLGQFDPPLACRYRRDE